MRYSAYFFLYTSALLLTQGYPTNPVGAQVIPDATLGSESSSIDNSTVFGGAARGNALFHSFEQFSIAPNAGISFFNPDGIDNILSRVTGDQISTINGTLGVDGSANLFFLNPNGIVFGPDARLNVVGSFTATTAASFTLGDAGEFRATNPNAAPLVDVNISLGLQFSPNLSAAIINQATLSTRRNLTLAGHGVDSTGELIANNGDIVVQGVSGNVNVRQLQAQSASLDANQALTLQNSQIETNGDVSLQGRRVSVEDSTIRTGADRFSFSESRVTGEITITGTEDVAIGESLISTGAQSSNVYPDFAYKAATGNISISGSTVTIENDSAITTALEESYFDEPPFLEGIVSGDVSISGNVITLANSDISTDILAVVNGGTTGDVDIIASDGVLIRDRTNIGTQFSAFTTLDSTIAAELSNLTGETGDIAITAGNNVIITDNSLVTVAVAEAAAPENTPEGFSGGSSELLAVSAVAFDPDGNSTSAIPLTLRGGNILLNADNTLEIGANSSVSNIANHTDPASNNQLTTGNIGLSTNALTLVNAAEIVVSNRQAAAGAVNITANDIEVNQSTIRTENGANIAGSGDINFNGAPEVNDNSSESETPDNSDLLQDSVAADTTDSRLTMTNEGLIASTGFNGATAGTISLENLALVSGLSPTGENGSDIISRGDVDTAGTRGTITVGNNVTGFTFQTAVPGNRTNDIETDPPPPPEPELPEFIEPQAGTNAFTPAATTFPQSLEQVRGYCETADAEDTINRGVAINGRGGLPTTPTDPLEAPVEDSGWIEPTASPIPPLAETALTWSNGKRMAASCRQVWTTS